MSEVIEAASSELAANGQIVHLFTTCTNGGYVNATRDDDSVSCTACEINILAAGLVASREAARG